jgi:hypothetical protein
VDVGVRASIASTIHSLHLLHEHVLDEAVRVFGEGVVVALPDFPDLLERTVTEHFSRFAKRPERVFCLVTHHNVTNESKVVALLRGISQISHGVNGRANRAFPHTGPAVQLGLIFLQHALVPVHVRYVSRAEIAEARVVCLDLMRLERAQKSSVLDNGVVDLTLQECISAVHHSRPLHCLLRVNPVLSLACYALIPFWNQQGAGQRIDRD